MILFVENRKVLLPLNTLKAFPSVLFLIFSAFASGGPVIVGDQQIIFNQGADPFQLRQIINWRGNVDGIQRAKIVTSQSSAKITPLSGWMKTKPFLGLPPKRLWSDFSRPNPEGSETGS